MAPPALVFPHLSPGSETCLHLLVPELHRYLWKRHWAQLLGIGLGWEELEDHRESHSPPKGRGLLLEPRDRGQCRETMAPHCGVGGGSQAGRARPREKSGEGDSREKSGCGMQLGGKGRWSWGSSQVNQFNSPGLPLAVCRSTSTVGLPLESRISRAKIFCMAMAAG